MIPAIYPHIHDDWCALGCTDGSAIAYREQILAPRLEAGGAAIFDSYLLWCLEKRYGPSTREIVRSLLTKDNLYFEVAVWGN
ncbi:MAG: hypothetical protein ACYC63_16685 [Armatimonadota bacterium]